jgi:hypothetical protein
MEANPPPNLKLTEGNYIKVKVFSMSGRTRQRPRECEMHTQGEAKSHAM